MLSSSSMASSSFPSFRFEALPLLHLSKRNKYARYTIQWWIWLILRITCHSCVIRDPHSVLHICYPCLNSMINIILLWVKLCCHYLYSIHISWFSCFSIHNAVYVWQHIHTTPIQLPDTFYTTFVTLLRWQLLYSSTFLLLGVLGDIRYSSRWHVFSGIQGNESASVISILNWSYNSFLWCVFDSD